MSGAMAAMAGVQMASSIYGAYKDREAARERAELNRYKAKLERMRATEYRSRSEINKVAMLRETMIMQGQQAGQFAGSGVDIAGGTPLLVMENTARRMGEEIILMRNDAEFNARQSEDTARLMELGADQVESAANSAFFASIFSGTTNAGLSYAKSSGSGTQRSGRTMQHGSTVGATETVLSGSSSYNPYQSQG